MAVSTDSYFSNSIVGQMQIGADVDIYETNETPKYAVGQGFERADGNRYRYSHFGETTAVGTIVAADRSESEYAQNGAVGCTGSTRGGEIFAANAIDSRYMEVVITATASQFAGGYLSVYTGTGTGYTYRIKDNIATTSINGVAGHVYIDLYDPLYTAIDTTSGICITPSKYANLETADYTADAVVAGATVCGVTATDYAWICTRGNTTCLQGVQVATHGSLVFLSTNTAGAVCGASSPTASSTNLTQPFIGTMAAAGTNAGYSIVYLQIE